MTRIEAFITAIILSILGVWMIISMYLKETGKVVPNSVAEGVCILMLLAWGVIIIVAAFKNHPFIVTFFTIGGMFYEAARQDGVFEGWSKNLPNPFYALGFNNAMLTVLSILCLVGAGALAVYSLGAPSHREYEYDGPIEG